MAIKSELTNDAARGPGHGLIRLAGLSAGTEHLSYCLERNQGSLPYLGENGGWQAQEVWHRVALDAASADGERIEFPVGPEVVDPLVEQPQHVMCRLTVDCNGEKQTAALKIQRPLLSSKAHALPTPPDPSPVVPSTPEPVPGPIPQPTDEMTRLLDVPSPVPEPILLDDPRKLRRIVAWTLLPTLLLAGGGGWLWWDCRIPSMPGPRCSGTGAAATVIPPVDDLPRNCSGLDGEACLSIAAKAQQAGQLERARQLLQEAGNLGAVKAYIRLGQMYDPATWAADQSPVARADWETAAYWYDEAARSGDSDGMLGAGRLYCGNSGDVAFRSHGVDLLRKAVTAAPGDSSAEQALKDCEEKLK